MRVALCAFVLVVATGWTMPAGADADAKLTEGKRLFETGRLHYDVGDFGEALSAFRQAYALTSEPTLLHDVGLCLQQLGRNDEAAQSFQQFLDRSPQLPERDRREVEAVVHELDGGKRRVVAAPAAKKETPLHRRWWLWTAVGGGVLVLSLGLGLGLGLRDHYDGTRSGVTFP